MGNDYIECFNEKECTYTACKQFNNQLDTCNFMIIGLLGGAVKQVEKKPIRDEPQRKPELGDKIMIRDLTPGDTSTKEHKINIEGEILYDPEIKTTPSGKLVTNLVIKDNTGQLRLAWWDDDTKTPMKYKKGDMVRVENIWKIDEQYEGTAQAAPGKWSKIIKL